jgi:ABC-2 type transport system permease protein
VKLPPINPVLARELRQRMRGPRAAIVITIYLLILSLIVWTVYESATRVQVAFEGPQIEQIAGLGRSVFQTLVFCVLLLVCFIVPGQSAGAIAGERERQTLVPVQVTLLRSRSILIGKLLASLAFVLLLIVATLPLVGIAFLLGGVEILEVVKTTAMLVVIATVLAATSMFCSTITRRTQAATVLSYGVVLALVLGSFMVFAAQNVFARQSGSAVENQLVLQLNPFMAMADVLDERADIVSGGGFSPFEPMQSLLRQRSDGGFRAAVDNVVFDEVGNDRIVQRQPGTLNEVPFIVFALLGYAGVTAGSIWQAGRRLDLPKVSV